MTNLANSARIGNRPLHIAVGAGHHNATGGDDYEVNLTGLICKAVVELCRASVGLDVRCYTPEDGLGMHRGWVDAAAREVATTWDPIWPVDIFHEIHVEAASTRPNQRGIFIIYPDSPADGDVDEDVRKQGPMMARSLAVATGLPLGGTAALGIMSERRTWVGSQERRLRVFAATATAGMRAHSCRFITEVGHHTNAEDRWVLDRPDFPRSCAVGVLRAYAVLAVAAMGWTRRYRIAGSIE